PPPSESHAVASLILVLESGRSATDRVPAPVPSLAARQVRRRRPRPLRYGIETKPAGIASRRAVPMQQGTPPQSYTIAGARTEVTKLTVGLEPTTARLQGGCST